MSFILVKLTASTSGDGDNDSEWLRRLALEYERDYNSGIDTVGRLGMVWLVP